jgi:hypothetical protein
MLRLRAFIRSTTFSPFGRAFAVMGLCQTLAAVSKATPPGNRTLFHSLGDHPLGIATRSTPTRQAIADGNLVIFPPTAITTPTASVPGTNGVNGRICYRSETSRWSIGANIVGDLDLDQSSAEPLAYIAGGF